MSTVHRTISIRYLRSSASVVRVPHPVGRTEQPREAGAVALHRSRCPRAAVPADRRARASTSAGGRRCGRRSCNRGRRSRSWTRGSTARGCRPRRTSPARSGARGSRGSLACRARGRRRTSARARGAASPRSGRTACMRASCRSRRSQRPTESGRNDPRPSPASVLDASEEVAAARRREARAIGPHRRIAAARSCHDGDRDHHEQRRGATPPVPRMATPASALRRRLRPRPRARAGRPICSPIAYVVHGVPRGDDAGSPGTTRHSVADAGRRAAAVVAITLTAWARASGS